VIVNFLKWGKGVLSKASMRGDECIESKVITLSFGRFRGTNVVMGGSSAPPDSSSNSVGLSP